VKAGIKKTWTPLGATVIWGEAGQYLNMFSGMCGNPGAVTNNATFCKTSIPSNTFNSNGTNVNQPVFVTGSEVNRWGVGVVQEIDSAAMHLWANWQHLELNLDAVQTEEGHFGKKASASFQDLDMFMVGGVIFF
jgi:hypothetical protein